MRKVALASAVLLAGAAAVMSRKVAQVPQQIPDRLPECKALRVVPPNEQMFKGDCQRTPTCRQIDASYYVGDCKP